MKVVVAGSRSIVDEKIVADAIEASGFDVTEVISGGARGVDSLGEEWAKARGIKVSRFPADWKTYGRGAGMIRNSLMLEEAEAVVAVWDGESRGTLDMMRKTKKAGKPLFVWSPRRQLYLEWIEEDNAAF